MVIHVGDDAPDFTLKTQDEKEWKLSAQRGKNETYVLPEVGSGAAAVGAAATANDAPVAPAAVPGQEVGIESVIGNREAGKVSDFVRKLAHISQWHAMSLYGQTGTGRHLSRYSHTLAAVTDYFAARR